MSPFRYSSIARPKAVTAGFGGEASGLVVPRGDTRLYGRGLGAKRIYALRLGFLRYGVISACLTGPA